MKRRVDELEEKSLDEIKAEEKELSETDLSKKDEFTEDLKFMTPSLQNKLKVCLTELKEVLKDDKDFFQDLMDQILLVGKGNYSHNIDSIIYEKYAKQLELTKFTNLQERSVYIEILDKLLATTREIIRLLTGDEAIQEKISHFPEEFQDKGYEILRDEVEHEISCILYSINNTEPTLIGDL